MQDPDILPLLRTLRRPTLISCDRDFYDRAFCSDRYCLVLMDVWPTEVAAYTRRLLRHPAFRTWSQRRGCVVRVSAQAILAWCVHARRATRYRWET
jgi:hypothetical protein